MFAKAAKMFRMTGCQKMALLFRRGRQKCNSLHLYWALEYGALVRGFHLIPYECQLSVSRNNRRLYCQYNGKIGSPMDRDAIGVFCSNSEQFCNDMELGARLEGLRLRDSIAGCARIERGVGVGGIRIR